MPFNPNEHLKNLEKNPNAPERLYLEVKWRLVWFREDHPDWGITTEVVHFDETKAVVKATITDETGAVKAQGTKQEHKAHFLDYLEKAETGAVGRALAHLGYGTQFAPELDEGDRIADSPVEVKAPEQADTKSGQQSQRRARTTPSKPAKTAESTNPPADGPHPNKTKVTEALTKAIYVAGGKLGLKHEDVHDFARGLYNMPELTSLYDLGKTKDRYMEILNTLNKRAAAQGE